jgi:pimeloyl-ACP methyl ester carboxylesterase
MPSETKYAKNGDVHIAYQVIGNGPIDLFFVGGFISHLEYGWEEPSYAQFFNRLASFSRLILYDKRGTGLSDRMGELPTLEQRMDDVRAVMDAVGSEKAALFGISEGGSMSILFAATYPTRVTALVLFGAFARRLWAPDYPWGQTREEREKYLDQTERDWGRVADFSPIIPGASAHDQHLRQWFADYQRLSASPGAAIALLRMNSDIDVRHVLPSIHVPTLILHRVDDQDVNVENSRYMAKHIPGAKYVELPGEAHAHIAGDTDSILNEVEEFLTGTRHAPEPDRVLATVMFTDIVKSTERVAEMGDAHWRDLLDKHHAILRRELTRFRGHEVKTTGDGFLATFDGPARAIRCAMAASDAVRELGIEIRAGLHTGEIELMDADVGGIAIHIGARVSALAGANEVLVSSTVKDLVAGSGITFSERGAHTLKGVPGNWQLFSVERASAKI